LQHALEFGFAKLNQVKALRSIARDANSPDQQLLVGEASYGSDRRRYDLLDVALVLVSFMKYFVILPVVTIILLRLLWGVWREPAPEAAGSRPSA
jgi:hypothetical protein